MPVKLKDVVKSYGGRRVLNGVSFTVEDGQFVSLIGPSGVGKTTLLNLLAGQDRADSGGITFTPPPNRDRPVLMVFQDFALFPHMSVAQNVAYGLKVRHRPRHEIQERVKSMLDWFDIAEKAEVYPHRLSAGQRQRAAIARALVVKPMILLLDEPFANLDKNLKGDTASFIRRTQNRFGITTVMVTHDQEEAFLVSDRIGVLLDGQIKQWDDPVTLHDAPESVDIARFMGPVNTLPRKIVALMDTFNLPSGDAPVSFRSGAVSLHPCADGPGEVRACVPIGVQVLYHIDLDGQSLQVHAPTGGLMPGDKVKLTLHRYIKEGKET